MATTRTSHFSPTGDRPIGDRPKQARLDLESGRTPRQGPGSSSGATRAPACDVEAGVVVRGDS